MSVKIGGSVPFGREMDKVKTLVQETLILAIIAMCRGRSCSDIAKKLNVEFNIQRSHAAAQRVLGSNEKKKSRFGE